MDEEYVRKMLATNRGWAEKALITLHNLQTQDEQILMQTTYKNGVGFNAVDAPFLSSLAESLERYPHLTPKQLTYAHKLLPKYAHQIYQIILEKAILEECNV